VNYCNALNLGVEFFSSFLSPNSGVTLFSLSFFAPSSQFQTSIVTGVRVMYKPKPKWHGCCIMLKHISLSDVECCLVPFRISIRDLIPFSGRARRGFRSAKWLGPTQPNPTQPGPARPCAPGAHTPHVPPPLLSLSLIWISRATNSLSLFHLSLPVVP
jgi:hypothetical protein